MQSYEKIFAGQLTKYLLRKSIFELVCAGEVGDEIFVGREPTVGLQFVGGEPFGGFVLKEGVG